MMELTSVESDESTDLTSAGYVTEASEDKAATAPGGHGQAPCEEIPEEISVQAVSSLFEAPRPCADIPESSEIRPAGASAEKIAAIFCQCCMVNSSDPA
mmetsp:Transcript_3434/g.7121  ORF Transcript_3434/g.7121 Transcript_3434/m.7121 type:complete len:99 (-) Transcript_3434:39-335(-)